MINGLKIKELVRTHQNYLLHSTSCIARARGRDPEPDTRNRTFQ